MSKREVQVKTNAMRELDQAHIPYRVQVVEGEEDISRGLGVRMAEEVGADPESQFKTLVCVSPTRDHVVCCIPVAEELDLKKAAAAAGEKSLELMPIKQLESVTGYVRGGCTPVGMKKKFPTYFHSTAVDFETIYVSAGVRGLQLEISPVALIDFVGGTVCEIAAF